MDLARHFPLGVGSSGLERDQYQPAPRVPFSAAEDVVLWRLARAGAGPTAMARGVAAQAGTDRLPSTVQNRLRRLRSGHLLPISDAIALDGRRPGADCPWCSAPLTGDRCDGPACGWRADRRAA